MRHAPQSSASFAAAGSIASTTGAGHGPFCPWGGRTRGNTCHRRNPRIPRWGTWDVPSCRLRYGPMRTIEDVNWQRCDFIDIGSGVGGSLQSVGKRIGGRGVGIDTNKDKVIAAQRRGLDVVYGDIFDLPHDISVRFVTFDNVLEHMPDIEKAENALGIACRIAREFVYIRHPSFEDEAYLAALGLKQYWTDWTGHPSHILLTDYMKMFARLGVRSWYAHPVKAALDSGDPTILPHNAPPDQHDYDEASHGSKYYISFARRVYSAFDIVTVVSSQVSRVAFEYLKDPDLSDQRPRVIVETDIPTCI